MTINLIDEVREKLLANLAEYGIQWDFGSETLIVDNLKLMQQQLAQHTNLGGLKYKKKLNIIWLNLKR